ncbi:hypothetical protein DYBT9623_01402 [Dyadobacter sp. CECT 9623]|uniref:DinB-like domain-containing protein n=1 Tax=Dyadobacter linearis TaxID=2823330 RepID=A0ABN7R3C3_9BACT|nr:DinB family protein [Dyadobacter sp. CECT 9623]CAG5068670.1 hypothetical protein DYBT9623_01402 [Dyadobacter sp. CECT 9623]
MKENQKPEVWLRGPIPHIPPLLQPVAHALKQAVEELAVFSDFFPADLLWEKPSGLASVGFHLQHLSGVLDRLFTYARSESLNENQLAYLKNEGSATLGDETYESLLFTFEKQVAASLKQLQSTPEATLTEVRYVGRAMVPSTQLGLLFHAAEHTQRHVGQLLVTARILLARQDQ